MQKGRPRTPFSFRHADKASARLTADWNDDRAGHRALPVG